MQEGPAVHRRAFFVRLATLDRVTACMIPKRASLSDGCKAVLRYEPAVPATPVSYAPSAKPSKPMNLTPHKRG
jgi:hypothetical protein